MRLIFCLIFTAVFAATAINIPAQVPVPPGYKVKKGKDDQGRDVQYARTGHVTNYDESKVKPYTLPDPLMLANGTAVRDADTWFKKRRPEILEMFRTEYIGHVPANTPQVKWEVASTDPKAKGGIATMKKVVGHIGDKPDGPRVNLTLYLPAKATGPVPVILTVGNGPTNDILAQGWAHATFSNTDIQPDRNNAYHLGVIGMTLQKGQTEPAPHEWRAKSAWAWGVSRVVDYLLGDKAIDGKCIAVQGHSRLGTTALWAGAQDERIAVVFASCSGESGASLGRRDFGSTIDDLTENYPWQHAGNLNKWVGRWNDMPIDSHMLIALMAPRGFFCNGGTTDQWADPKGEFLAMVAAGPVFKLLGGKDLGATELPPLDTPLIDGDLGWIYHTGGHTCPPGDWRAFYEFAGKQFKTKAEDYPQWRGPNRDGVSRETGLLKEWPKDGPTLRWQTTDLGWGYATPSLAKGRIYLIGSPEVKPGKTEHVIALNEADGKKIWSTKIGNVGPNTKQQYPGPRSTPTVDGNRLYALGSDGDLACLDIDKGDIVWQKSFRADFDGKMGFWAYSESPLIDGDLVVCSPGGKKATMVALNKADGKVVWQCPLPEGDPAGYASAIVCAVDGIRQYVQFLEKGLVGVEAKTGKFLWRYTNTSDSTFFMNCPTPIFHDGYVLSATSVKGAGLVKLAADGAKMTATQIYLNKKLQNNHGGLVLVDEFIYGTNSSTLLCMDFKTGKELWSNRCVGKGSLCYADGRLYVRGERGGAVALVDANAQSYQEKGRFTPPGSSSTDVWPHPVVANGCLYLRDQGKLFCYDIKAPVK